MKTFCSFVFIIPLSGIQTDRYQKDCRCVSPFNQGVGANIPDYDKPFEDNTQLDGPPNLSYEYTMLGHHQIDKYA